MKDVERDPITKVKAKQAAESSVGEPEPELTSAEQATATQSLGDF